MAKKRASSSGCVSAIRWVWYVGVVCGVWYVGCGTLSPEFGLLGLVLIT